MRAWLSASVLLCAACGPSSVDHVSVAGADPSADVQVADLNAALRYLESAESLTISVDGGHHPVKQPLVVARGQTLSLAVQTHPEPGRDHLTLGFETEDGVVLEADARLEADRDLSVSMGSRDDLALYVGHDAVAKVNGEALLYADVVVQPGAELHTMDLGTFALQVHGGSVQARDLHSGDVGNTAVDVYGGGSVRARTVNTQASGSGGVTVRGRGSELIVSDWLLTAMNGDAGLVVQDGAEVWVHGTLEVDNNFGGGAVAVRDGILHAGKVWCTDNRGHDLVAEDGGHIDASGNEGCRRIRLVPREHGTSLDAD